MKRLLDSQRETLIPDLDLSLTCSEPWAGLSISLFFFFLLLFLHFLKYRAYIHNNIFSNVLLNKMPLEMLHENLVL